MITYILILSLLIFGLAALFDEGMLLEHVADFLVNENHIRYRKDWLRSHWHKPIFSCPICMASVWGTIASSYLYSTGRFTTLSEWLILVFATCGLNYIITRWLSK